MMCRRELGLTLPGNQVCYSVTGSAYPGWQCLTFPSWYILQPSLPPRQLHGIKRRCSNEISHPTPPLTLSCTLLSALRSFHSRVKGSLPPLPLSFIAVPALLGPLGLTALQQLSNKRDSFHCSGLLLPDMQAQATSVKPSQAKGTWLQQRAN